MRKNKFLALLLSGVMILSGAALLSGCAGQSGGEDNDSDGVTLQGQHRCGKHVYRQGYGDRLQ